MSFIKSKCVPNNFISRIISDLNYFVWNNNQSKLNIFGLLSSHIFYNFFYLFVVSNDTMNYSLILGRDFINSRKLN